MTITLVVDKRVAAPWGHLVRNRSMQPLLEKMAEEYKVDNVTLLNGGFPEVTDYDDGRFNHFARSEILHPNLRTRYDGLRTVMRDWLDERVVVVASQKIAEEIAPIIRRQYEVWETYLVPV